MLLNDSLFSHIVALVKTLAEPDHSNLSDQTCDSEDCSNCSGTGSCGFLALLGIHQIEMSDPYVQEVISLTEDIDRGHAIFQMNCAGCHGLEARGRVGPSLRSISGRRSQLSLIHQITSGRTPPMPKFQASPEDMADLLGYLKTL